MKKLLFILLLIPILPSCVTTAALMTGATVGGAIIYDNRSVKTMLQDRHITVLAQKRINTDPELSQKVHVSVATLNHIVLLVGQAPTPQLRARAVAAVRSVPHIRRIYNQIIIGDLTTNMMRSKDSLLTAKVKTRVFGKAGLKDTSQLKVVSENGVVYLMGMTSHTEGNKLARIASKVSDVKKVVKVFEYIQ